MDTLQFIKHNKLVAISRKVYGDDLLKAAQCLIEGGIKLMEITFDQSDPECLELTGSSIRLVKDTLGDQICVGAGTVMTTKQAQAAKAAGADFALAPNTDVEVIKEMKRLQMIAVPGALTPSEIAIAYNAGADIVKVFPVATLGLDYIKAVQAPISHIPLMAVGGVSESNVKDFLTQGFSSAGIGSNIINAKKIAAGDFASVKQAAQAFVQAIQ